MSDVMINLMFFHVGAVGLAMATVPLFAIGDRVKFGLLWLNLLWYIAIPINLVVLMIAWTAFGYVLNALGITTD